MIVYTNKHKIPFEIDEEDYEIVSRFSWSISEGYPITGIRTYVNDVHCGGKSIRLHQLLMGFAPPGFEWDHINRDRLDNCRKNFRLTDKVGQMRNRTLRGNTGYSGIHKKINGKFVVRIGLNGEKIVVGTNFETIEEAVAARKAAEIKYWGRNY